MNRPPQPSPGPSAARLGFYRDRDLGRMAEDAVAKVLARRFGCDVQHSNGLDTRGDLTVNGHPVEVKCDLIAHRTKRVAVEIARDGRPSGVKTSAAEMVAIVVPPSPTARLIPREALLQLADVSPRQLVGDGGRTLCALVPVGLLLKHSEALPLGEDDARRLAAAAPERRRRP